MAREVLTVLGVGGMGHAIARRLGAGKTVLLADNNAAALMSVANTLSRPSAYTSSAAFDPVNPDR